MVSGANRCTTPNATTAKAPNTAKAPAPPSECSIVRKPAATIALAVRVKVSVVLDPIDRRRVGKASPAYTHTSEPNPKLKPMMNSSTPTTPNIRATPWAKTAISTASAVITMAMPDNRIGRRPSRSTRKSEAHTAANAASCTSAGTPSFAKLPLKPMFSNSRGL